jgi:hypothetical protein
MTNDEKSPLENEVPDPKFFMRSTRLGLGGLETEYPVHDRNGMTYQEMANQDVRR